MTNKIDSWNKLIVTASNMPFRLDLNTVKISKRSSGYSDAGFDDKTRRFYIRMSAINQEFGEGPYSNIVELRQPDKSMC